MTNWPVQNDKWTGWTSVHSIVITAALVYTLKGEYGDILSDPFDMALYSFPENIHRFLPVQIFALAHPRDALFFLTKIQMF